MARMILEVLDAQGGVRSRTRLHSSPITIGRAFHNDVILDDPYVDATHVRIVSDESGALVAEDAGSVNGMGRHALQPKVSRLFKRHVPDERVSRARIEPGLALRVGRTLLHFRDIDAAVAPALVETPIPVWYDVPALARSTRTTVPLLLATLLLVGAKVYIWNFDRRGARAVGMVIAIFIGMLVWAAIWSLATRLRQHVAEFRAHFSLTCVGAIGMIAVGGVVGVASAIFPALLDTSALMGITMLACVVLLVVAHLAVASRLSKPRRWFASIAGVGGFVALLSAGAGRDGYSTRLRYSHALYPVSTGVLHTVSAERFAERAAGLRAALDSAAVKPR